MENIGAKISSLRKEKGLSQEELAAALYVSRQSVSKWERGQSIPDAENISAMCAFFGVSADSVLGCTPPESAGEIHPPEKPAKKSLWLKILIISLVAFFAYMGLMATVAFIFTLTVETNPIIWTRVVPMIFVMLVIIFGTVLGVVIALHKKGQKPRK